MGKMNAMRLFSMPRPVLQLLLAFLLTSPPVGASPNPHPSEQAGFTFDELFARYDCAGTACGYYGQLCCPVGQGCYTDTNTIVSCTSTAAAAAGSGYWQYYTTTYTQTDLKTITATMSTYVGGVGVATAPAAGATCVPNYQLNESPCGPICCSSNQYCFAQGQCAPAANSGSSGLYNTPTAGNGGGATQTPGAPVRGTTSGVTTTTATASPTTTVPFIPPVATGANVTVTGAEATSGGGGLSGGAIAGIVIGVLAALLILGFILFCCCLKGMIDGCLACFGIGGRKKSRRTEVEEYERYSHHTSGGQRRTWYGAPIRTSRPEPIKEKKSGGGNMLAILGGLAGLWAILGLKRRHENKERREREDEYTEYSYSEDYYTSASKWLNFSQKIEETWGANQIFFSSYR